MPPTTQFEDSGGVQWTSLANEQSFLEAIAGETDAVLSDAGRSVQNRSIWRIDIGDNAASTWMIVSLQHANERAAREALLSWFRDIAYSTSPIIQDYLANHRVAFVPNVNPDGFVSGTRENAHGVDINRDLFEQSQPETRAVYGVFNDCAPGLLLDAHEQRFSTTNMLYRRPELTCLYPGMHPMGQDLQDYVADAYDDTSYTHDAYPVPGRKSLREGAALRHVLGFLLETDADADPNERVDVYRVGINALREWHAVNSADLAQLTANSRSYALNTDDAYRLQKGITNYPWPEIILPGHLTGYELDQALPQAIRDAWDIEVDSGRASLAQEARLVLPILLDEQSDDQLVNATRELESVNMWEDVTAPGGEVIRDDTVFDIPNGRYDRVRVKARGRMSAPGTMTMRVNQNVSAMYESAWARLDTSATNIQDSNDFDGTSWTIGKWNGATWCSLELELATCHITSELGFEGRSMEGGTAGNRSITLTSGTLTDELLLSSITLGLAVGTFRSARVWIEGHLAA